MIRPICHSLVLAALLAAGCSVDLPTSSHHSDVAKKSDSWNPHHSPHDDLPTQPPVVVAGSHPRLFFADSEIPALKAAIARDPISQRQFDSLKHQADDMLRAAPAEYVKDTEKAVTVSRLVLSRVSALAGVYRLTGERQYAARAIGEMLAAANFPEWHPDDFLPAAELINALGIGYDWLYPMLTPADRKTIRDAILNKGLLPAQQAYKHDGDWTRTESNHNIVGNGGVAVGAMALANDQPKLSSELVTDTRHSLPTAVDQYQPDGAWPEGPIYWDYATRYATFYLASLSSAAGEPADTSRWEGLAETGLFRIYSTGPTNKTFNFGDAEEIVHPAPFMYWLSKQFNKPIYAAHEQMIAPDDPNIFAVIWRARLTSIANFESLASKKLPPSAIFRGSELAFLRSDWTPDATWIGIKGGTNKGTHRHLDLGSFVLDAQGERWAIDLGPDNYGLPGYNGSDQRWSYYRCQTEGHNTLTINGPNQEYEGDATLLGFHTDPQRSYAVVDLTNAYTHAKSILRGVELLNGRDLVMVDELDLQRPSKVTWNFHTRASISPQGRNATLEQNGKRMHLQILEPAGATFEVEPATAPPPQTANPGVSNLTIHLPSLVEKTRIVVMMSPDEAGGMVHRDAVRAVPAAAVKVDPLNRWVEAGKIKR